MREDYLGMVETFLISNVTSNSASTDGGPQSNMTLGFLLTFDIVSSSSYSSVGWRKIVGEYGSNTPKLCSRVFGPFGMAVLY